MLTERNSLWCFSRRLGKGGESITKMGNKQYIEDIANNLSQFNWFDKTRWDKYQRPVMKLILEEESSTIAVLPTGAGKSLLFQYFARFNHEDGLVLVVEPLRSIIENQIERFNTQFSNARACDATILKKEYIDSDVAIIFVSPEELFIYARKLLNSAEKIQMVVIDEVHTLFDWGVSFRNEFLYVPHFTKLIKEKRKSIKVLALTATITESQKDLCARMLDAKCWSYEKSIVLKEEEKEYAKTHIKPNKPDFLTTTGGSLKQLFDEALGSFSLKSKEKAIAFFKDYYVIDSFLRHVSRLISGFYFHENLYSLRTKAQAHVGYLVVYKRDFNIEKKKELLAYMDNPRERATLLTTKALAMGVDLQLVQRVIIFGIPESWNCYIQEIGRIRNESKDVVFLYSSADAVSMLNKFQKEEAALSKTCNSLDLAIMRMKVWDYLCIWDWVLDSMHSSTAISFHDNKISLEQLLAKRPRDVRKKLERIVNKDGSIKQEKIAFQGFDTLFARRLKLDDLELKPLFVINMSKALISFDKDNYPGLFNCGKAMIEVRSKKVDERSKSINAILESDIDLDYFDFLVFNAVYTHHMYSTEKIDAHSVLEILLGQECGDETLLDLVSNSLAKIQGAEISGKVKTKTRTYRINPPTKLYEGGVFPLFDVLPTSLRQLLLTQSTPLEMGRIRKAFDAVKGRGKNLTPINIISVYYTLFGIERHKAIFRNLYQKSQKEKKYPTKFTSFCIPNSLPSIEGAMDDWLNSKSTKTNRSQERARIKKKMKRVLLAEYNMDVSSMSDEVVKTEYEKTVERAFGLGNRSKNKKEETVKKNSEKMKKSMEGNLISCSYYLRFE